MPDADDSRHNQTFEATEPAEPCGWGLDEAPPPQFKAPTGWARCGLPSVQDVVQMRETNEIRRVSVCNLHVGSAYRYGWHDPRSDGPTEPTRLAHEAIATKPFSFIVRDGEELGLEEAVFQALGAASMCWSEPPNGVFESRRAEAIGQKLLQFISEKLSEF